MQLALSEKQNRQQWV